MPPAIGTHQLHKGQAALLASMTDAESPETICQFIKDGLQIAELRLDLFTEKNINAFHATIATTQSKVPVLATLRTSSEGGQWHTDAASYFALLNALVTQDTNNKVNQPNALDIEIAQARAAPESAHALRALLTKQSIVHVWSYHNFHTTPHTAQLQEQLKSAHAFGADIIKIACMPETEADVRRLAHFTKQHADTHNLVTIAMGRLGAESRATMGKCGSLMTFASGTQSSAPGQMPLSQLRDLIVRMQQDKS